MLTVMSYSSLAVVLLTATLAETGMVPAGVALGLVLGANVGSGVLAVLSTSKASVSTRRLPAGNLLFKQGGLAFQIFGLFCQKLDGIFGLLCALGGINAQRPINQILRHLLRFYRIAVIKTHGKGDC